MADTSTKSVAARLPIDEYVKFIATAQAAKMSKSDYLIQKIYAPDLTPLLQQTQQQLQQLQMSYQQLEEQTQRQQQDIQDKETLLHQRQQTIQALQADQDQLQQSLQTAIATNQKLAQWRVAAATLEQKNRQVAAEREQLSQQLAELEQALAATQQQLVEQTSAFQSYQAKMQTMKTELLAIHQKATMGGMTKDIRRKLDEYIVDQPLPTALELLLKIARSSAADGNPSRPSKG